MSRGSKLLIGLCLVPAFLMGAFIVLRACGLIRPFSVPTSAMTPAISPGDHIMMEGVSLLFGKPHRGDIVIFKADGIASLPPGQIYVKRVAGEPGEHLRIAEGALFINDKQVSLSNASGRIVYDPPPNAGTLLVCTDLIVSSGSYFVLGDNSTNSLDSRFWGAVPSGNIIGQTWFCYWPPRRAGPVK